MANERACPCGPCLCSLGVLRGAWRHFLARLTAPAVHDYAVSRPLAKCSVEVLDGVIMGRDKWLMRKQICEALLGSAPRVLKVSPADGAVETIGPELPGKFKWLRGIHVDGSIYGVPTNSDRVLHISPAAGTVDLIGESFTGGWKWHGGVLSPVDRCVYAIPCNAESVLKIFPDGRVTTIGEGSPVLKGRCKWYGGLLGGDGCIYGIPNCAESVLKIDPAKQEVSTIGPKFLQGGQKWHGGVVGKAERLTCRSLEQGLRRTPLMLMMRALGGFRNPLKKLGIPRLGRPSAHDARRLASLGSSTAAPKPAIAWGMAAKTCARSEKPPGEVPRGPMEKRGSDEAGPATQGVVAYCFAESYKARSEPSSDTKRTQALGDRALPDNRRRPVRSPKIGQRMVPERLRPLCV
eukprot:s7232_g2.t2